MTRIHWPLALIAILATSVRTVRSQATYQLISLANAAEKAGDFRRATELYHRFYLVSGFDPSALAIAALSAAKSGDDSAAVEYFRQAVREGFLNTAFLDHVERDTSLIRLRRSPALRVALEDARRRTTKLNKDLRDELLALAARDQRNRDGLQALVERLGTTSKEGDSAMRALSRADEPILARVLTIVSANGWPGRSLVADDGAHAAWLVVQHAPDSVQLRLLPVIRQAIESGEGRRGDLALLEDRVLVADGKPQIYGSRLLLSARGGPPTLAAVVDEACVDRRRASVGLAPLAEYLGQFGIAYVAPQLPCK